VIETSSDATRFVAMVAHELRGPLHAVPPLCGLVDDALSEGNVLQARRLVRLVAKQSHELIELSNALLGLSGIFGIAPEPVAVDLTACAREAVATVGAFPAHRDSDLSCIRIDRLPTVWGDPALLRQVFVNLPDGGAALAGGAIRPPAPKVDPGARQAGQGPSRRRPHRHRRSTRHRSCPTRRLRTCSQRAWQGR